MVGMGGGRDLVSAISSSSFLFPLRSPPCLLAQSPFFGTGDGWTEAMVDRAPLGNTLARHPGQVTASHAGTLAEGRAHVGSKAYILSLYQPVSIYLCLFISGG